MTFIFFCLKKFFYRAIIPQKMGEKEISFTARQAERKGSFAARQTENKVKFAMPAAKALAAKRQQGERYD